MKALLKQIILFRYLYLAEKLLLIFALICTLLYLVLDLPSIRVLNLYWEQIRTLLYAYPLGLLIVFVIMIGITGFKAKKAKIPNSEIELWKPFRASHFNLSEVCKDLRYFNVIILMLVIFAALKHLIPHINPVLYDKELLAFEHWLLGGQTAFEFLDGFIDRSHAAIISNGYQAYYIYLSVLVFIFVLQRDYKLREEFCIAFCLLWFIGVLIVYTLPTWGPCFYIPEVYESLPKTRMTIMQADLWSMKESLAQAKGPTTALFAISGLPSLHLALVILGSFYLAKLNIIVSLISWGFALVTVLTTLYFGWHYILDDVASFLLVGGVILLSRYIVFRSRL